VYVCVYVCVYACTCIQGQGAIRYENKTITCAQFEIDKKAYLFGHNGVYVFAALCTFEYLFSNIFPPPRVELRLICIILGSVMYVIGMGLIDTHELDEYARFLYMVFLSTSTLPIFCLYAKRLSEINALQLSARRVKDRGAFAKFLSLR
jgi:hypothetical protein